MLLTYSQFSGTCFAQGEQLDADAIRLASQGARTYFYGKEIEYRIEVQDFPSSEGGSFYTVHPMETQRGTRRISIGESSSKRSYIPTRLMHFQPNQGEPHLTDDPLLTFFQGYNGHKTCSFVRTLLNEYGGKRRIESSGTEQVGCAVGAFRADPMATLIVNQWEPFMGLPVKKYEFVEMGNRVKAERVEHPADDRAIRIASTDPDIAQYVILSSEPEYLVLERGRQSPDRLPSVEITELKEFDGYRYPSRASVRQFTADGKYGWSAEVELIDVREIDASQTKWIPDWPIGTEWKREKDGKRFQLPYTSAQMKKIRAAGLAKARSDSLEGSPGFFNINLLLLAVVFALVVYRFWPRAEPTT